ncbi:unannotated protein [freshwater metagenome]|uniref:Unannotated protein n=1 Tax=freshwater metagenome TaxID=449393 RepID=A0A6J7C4G7_9ZZZZ
MIAAAARAGLTPQVGAASFPAATTTVTPSAIKALIAASTNDDAAPPKLMLATAGMPATWSAITQLMPAIMIELVL